MFIRHLINCCRGKRSQLGSEDSPMDMISMLREIQLCSMNMQRDPIGGRKFTCFGRTLQSIKAKQKVLWQGAWRLSRCPLTSLMTNGIISKNRSMALGKVTDSLHDSLPLPPLFSFLSPLYFFPPSQSDL
jgi:hypothetical protein